jgi:TolB-like protein
MRRFFIYLLSICLSLNLAAQDATKPDIILKGNGEEMKGKVTEVLDNSIKFIYTGETAVYEIKKSDIVKITYSSGRVETITAPSSPTEKNEGSTTANPAANANADHHNKVAVLPFGFIKDNTSEAGSEVGRKVQTDAYTYLVKHAPQYTILDPRTTNALLMKAGVTAETKEGFTMDELCNILGVEYILEGTITQNKGMQSNSTYGNANTSTNYKDDGKNRKTYGSTSSNSYQTYITSVSMNIYNDKNKNIYSQNHRALLASIDGSYTDPLNYLLKRCPLHSN